MTSAKRARIRERAVGILPTLPDPTRDKVHNRPFSNRNRSEAKI